MPHPKAIDPIKFCATCGNLLTRKRFESGLLEGCGDFNRRKFCDRNCSSKSKVKEIKTENGWRSHNRKNLPRADKCIRCGTPENLQVNHKDEDFTNNSPENLETVCGSCHMKAHWAEWRNKPLSERWRKRSGKLSKEVSVFS